MKNLILIAMAMVLMAGCASEQKNWSASVLGDKNSLTTRIGYDIGKIEVGGEAAWLDLTGLPGNAGVYGKYKFDPITVPNPIPLEFLPTNLMMTPFIGGQAGIDILNNGVFVGPIAGLDMPPITIEWEYINTDFKLGSVGDAQKIIFGLRFEF